MEIISNIILALIVILTLLMLFTAMVNLFVKAPYVPSKKRTIEYILKLAKLKSGENVYDLGCGDGRFLIEAQKIADIKATGFEAAPIPYLLAILQKYLYKAKMKILFGNFFKKHLGNADVIFCYLGPEVMAKLAKKFKNECRKGTRIFSSTFHMKGMEPVKVWPKNPKQKLPTIYLYQI